MSFLIISFSMYNGKKYNEMNLNNFFYKCTNTITHQDIFLGPSPIDVQNY